MREEIYVGIVAILTITLCVFIIGMGFDYVWDFEINNWGLIRAITYFVFVGLTTVAIFGGKE